MAALQPTEPEALLEAQCLLANREIGSALKRFEEAEVLGASPIAVAAGRWDCWMLIGDFERAWQESDRIRKTQHHDPHRFWDGKPLDERHVILRCLHGFGDSIQFLRYLPLIKRIAKSLTIQVPPQILPLFQNTSWACLVDSVITWEQPEPFWNAQIECIELPYIFRTTLEDIPPPLPPLEFPSSPNSDLRDGRNCLHVGLVWSAGEWNPSRAIAITEFRLLVEMRDIAFHNLQGGPATRDWPLLEKHCAIVTGAIAEGTLNLVHAICHMDLIITVDTFAAHLGGALAKPTWLLLQPTADWRWMIDRSDSPWYPSITIFRRSRNEDWRSVISRIQVELDKLARAGRNTTINKPDIQTACISG